MFNLKVSRDKDIRIYIHTNCPHGNGQSSSGQPTGPNRSPGGPGEEDMTSSNVPFDGKREFPLLPLIDQSSQINLRRTGPVHTFLTAATSGLPENSPRQKLT